MMGSLLVGLVIVAALGLLGVQLLRTILGKGSWLEVLSFAYPIGAGVFTWLLFLLAWMGLRITPISVAAAWITALIGTTWTARVRHGRVPRPSGRPRSDRRETTEPNLPLGLTLTLALLLLIALALSVGRSYAAYDAMAGWAIKGYAIAAGGTVLAGRDWGMWGLNYPMNIMLQVATFRLFGGDLLPESKLIFPIYLASACLGIYLFWRRFKVAPLVAALGVLLLATNPVVFIQATNGYANLPFAATITLGVLTGIDGIMKGDAHRQMLSGLLLGSAVWTRPEGILYAGLFATAFLAISRLGRIGTARPLAILSPLAVLSSPWLLFARMHYELDPAWIQHGDTAGFAFANLLEGISNGGAQLFNLYLIPRLFVERAVVPENWGAYLPVVVSLVAISAFLRHTWRRGEIAHLAAAAAVTILVPIALYFVLSVQGRPDFVELLRLDFDRAYLPAYLLTTVLAVSLVQPRDEQGGPARWSPSRGGRVGLRQPIGEARNGR